VREEFFNNAEVQTARCSWAMKRSQLDFLYGI